AEEGFAAVLPVDLSLRRSTEAMLAGTPEAPIWQDSLLLRFTLPDTSSLQAGHQFVHQLRTAVPPGEYELSLVVPADTRTARRPIELQRDVIIPDYDRPDFIGISDVTLATAIQPSDDRGHPF